MKKILAVWLAIALALSSIETLAETQTERDSASDASLGLYGEIRIVSMRSRNREVQRDLFSKQFYLEKEFSNDFSLWGMLYHDEEFRSGYLGLAKKLGGFQIGIGMGPAQFDGFKHNSLAAWSYYHAGPWSALVSYEYYKKRAEEEEKEPLFYKAYAERRFGNGFLLGAYGEKGSGFGPMAGWYLWDKAKLWVSVPVLNRPSGENGGVKAFAGLTVEFEF
jgi:hypothetical protein